VIRRKDEKIEKLTRRVKTLETSERRERETSKLDLELMKEEIEGMKKELDIKNRRIATLKHQNDQILRQQSKESIVSD